MDISIEQIKNIDIWATDNYIGEHRKFYTVNIIIYSCKRGDIEDRLCLYFSNKKDVNRAISIFKRLKRF